MEIYVTKIRRKTGMQSKLITEKMVYNFAIFGGLQYVILTIIGMLIYPGGTRLDNETVGYSFTKNFLSDIARTEAYDGTAHLMGTGLYFWALLVMGSASILMFIVLRYIFREKKWTKIVSILMAITGVFAGTGLIGIGIAPSDVIYDEHMFFVFSAFLFLQLSISLLMICIYGTPRFPNKYAHALLATNIILFGYIGLMFYGPDPRSSDAGLLAQVVGQKFIVYLLIINLIYQAFGAKKVWAKMQGE
jgi:hypothetical protein